MKINNQKKNSGFTMIEMIIAVFIFTMSLAALMSIASRGLKAAHQAQKQVIGDYLALEGVEVIRNMRDSAFLTLSDTNDWQNVFNQNECLDHALGGGSCEFILSSSDIILRPCPSDKCIVYFSESESSYRHNQVTGAVPSGFIRNLDFKLTDNPDELNVTITVAWNNGRDSVSYSEDLFLWL